MPLKKPDLLNDAINDDQIIQACRFYYNKLDFIRDNTKDLFKSLFKKIGAKKKVNLLLYTDELMKIWEALLTDVIVFLKKHDSREFEKDMKEDWIDEESFGIKGLTKYFEHFSKFEKILYGADHFYRDHTAHVFRVWVMGVSIMKYFKEKSIEIKTDIDQNPKNTEGLEIQYEEKEALWCITALSHDLGYPLGKIKGINESIRQIVSYFGNATLEDFAFSFPPQTHFINDFILRFISSKLVFQDVVNKTIDGKEIPQNRYKTSLQSKYYLKFSRSFEEYDHGIVSCIILMKNLVYFLESDFDFDEIKYLDSDEDARQFQIRKEILRSIATHTCKDIYHLDFNTFSFLLFLCDEIQFWGRPIFDDLIQGDFHDSHAEIKELSDKSIYVILDFTKHEDMKASYFVSKAKHLRKVFRTAVKTKTRKYSFKFEVKDKYNSYIIVFEPQKTVKIQKRKNKTGCNYSNTNYSQLLEMEEKHLKTISISK